MMVAKKARMEIDTNKEELNMAERIILNEQELDSVVGGAFHYIEKNGYRFCVVDNVGNYFASADAFGKISAYAADTTKSAQEVVNWALQNGYLSTSPI